MHAIQKNNQKQTYIIVFLLLIFCCYKRYSLTEVLKANIFIAILASLDINYN